MGKTRRHFKALFIILAVILLLIAAFYGALRGSINRYNSTLRSDKTDEGLSITIAPRGGVTDS